MDMEATIHHTHTGEDTVTDIMMDTMDMDMEAITVIIDMGIEVLIEVTDMVEQIHAPEIPERLPPGRIQEQVPHLGRITGHPTETLLVALRPGVLPRILITGLPVHRIPLHIQDREITGHQIRLLEQERMNQGLVIPIQELIIKMQDPDLEETIHQAIVSPVQVIVLPITGVAILIEVQIHITDPVAIPGLQVHHARVAQEAIHPAHHVAAVIAVVRVVHAPAATAEAPAQAAEAQAQAQAEVQVAAAQAAHLAVAHAAAEVEDNKSIRDGACIY